MIFVAKCTIMVVITGILLLFVVGGPSDILGEQKDIRALLEQQQRDWNRGDIDAFMEGYEKSDDLVFTSGGIVFRGWRSALERYKKNYPNPETMGRLEFSNVEIRILGSDAAVVLGKWSLTRKNDNPHGIFTLVLRKHGVTWKIIHDHTSSSP
jgi:ketosteroid isomerase-like protein